jgi:tRNA(Arg) A34 adenosine deaminase TadA
MRGFGGWSMAVPTRRRGRWHRCFQLVSDDRLNHRVEVTAGVLAEQAAAGLRAFFAELRRGPAFGKGEGGDGGSGRSDPG